MKKIFTFSDTLQTNVSTDSNSMTGFTRVMTEPNRAIAGLTRVTADPNRVIAGLTSVKA